MSPHTRCSSRVLQQTAKHAAAGKYAYEQYQHDGSGHGGVDAREEAAPHRVKGSCREYREVKAAVLRRANAGAAHGIRESIGGIGKCARRA